MSETKSNNSLPEDDSGNQVNKKTLGSLFAIKDNSGATSGPYHWKRIVEWQEMDLLLGFTYQTSSGKYEPVTGLSSAYKTPPTIAINAMRLAPMDGDKACSTQALNALHELGFPKVEVQISSELAEHLKERLQLTDAQLDAEDTKGATPVVPVVQVSTSESEQAQPSEAIEAAAASEVANEENDVDESVELEPLPAEPEEPVSSVSPPGDDLESTPSEESAGPLPVEHLQVEPEETVSPVPASSDQVESVKSVESEESVGPTQASVEPDKVEPAKPVASSPSPQVTESASVEAEDDEIEDEVIPELINQSHPPISESDSRSVSSGQKAPKNFVLAIAAALILFFVIGCSIWYVGSLNKSSPGTELAEPAQMQDESSISSDTAEISVESVSQIGAEPSQLADEAPISPPVVAETQSESNLQNKAEPAASSQDNSDSVKQTSLSSEKSLLVVETSPDLGNLPEAEASDDMVKVMGAQEPDPSLSTEQEMLPGDEKIKDELAEAAGDVAPATVITSEENNMPETDLAEVTEESVNESMTVTDDVKVSGNSAVKNPVEVDSESVATVEQSTNDNKAISDVATISVKPSVNPKQKSETPEKPAVTFPDYVPSF